MLTRVWACEAVEVQIMTELPSENMDDNDCAMNIALEEGDVSLGASETQTVFNIQWRKIAHLIINGGHVTRSLRSGQRLPAHFLETRALGLSAFDVLGKLVLAGLHTLFHAEDHKPHLFHVRPRRFDARLVTWCLLGRRGARGLASVG